jgi:hypothetical protein
MSVPRLQRRETGGWSEIEGEVTSAEKGVSARKLFLPAAMALHPLLAFR